MLTLTRIRSPEQTLGILRLLRDEQEEWSCYTLELPWDSNERCESCIPPAPGSSPRTYHAEKHHSPRFGDCLWVKGVQGRSEILVHAGNYVSDTSGCVLVGEKFTDLDGDGLSDVTRSRDTLGELLAYCEGTEALRVGWHGPADIAPLEEVEAAAVS